MLSLWNTGNSMKQPQAILLFLVNLCRSVREQGKTRMTVPSFTLSHLPSAEWTFGEGRGPEERLQLRWCFCRGGQRLGVWRFQCRCFQNGPQGRLAVNKPEEERDKRDELGPRFKPLPYSSYPVLVAKLCDWRWDVRDSNRLLPRVCWKGMQDV